MNITPNGYGGLCYFSISSEVLSQVLSGKFVLIFEPYIGYGGIRGVVLLKEKVEKTIHYAEKFKPPYISNEEITILRYENISRDTFLKIAKEMDMSKETSERYYGIFPKGASITTAR